MVACAKHQVRAYGKGSDVISSWVLAPTKQTKLACEYIVPTVLHRYTQAMKGVEHS